MKIVGTGVDIVETQRVAESVEKFGERFLRRCFLPGEIAYCQAMRYPAPHFAARFAAKEAISKAFGTGIGRQLGWQDMEIAKRESGEPFIVWHGKGVELAAARGVTVALVSLAHTQEYAVAHAILATD